MESHDFSRGRSQLAGVPESQLNQYIEKHKSNANGKSLSSTETQLRSDRASKDLTRNDQNAIPVICMGYSGGWGGDLNELTEQINLMLNTYSQTEDYVVMGFYPNGWTDTAGYDSAMSSAFGDHYLSVNHPRLKSQACRKEEIFCLSLLLTRIQPDSRILRRGIRGGRPIRGRLSWRAALPGCLFQR